MNLTLNKTVKITAVVLILSVICALMCACGDEKIPQVETADSVSIGGSAAADWFFTYTDSETIDTLVEMYNSIKYEPTEDGTVLNVFEGNDVYHVQFRNGDVKAGEIWLDKDRNFMLDVDGAVYHITSEFDYDKFAGFLQDKIDESMLK